MASFLEMLVGGTAAGAGFVLGVGAALAGAQRSRPLLKQAMKSYLVATDRAREVAAEMGETLEDLYAEARAEYEAESKGVPAAESKPTS
ncbi:MAG: DUF5132 domain-containing protein [Chloroflexota bacterium]